MIFASLCILKTPNGYSTISYKTPLWYKTFRYKTPLWYSMQSPCTLAGIASSHI